MALITVKIDSENNAVVLEAEGIIASAPTLEAAKKTLLGGLGTAAVTNMFVDGLIAICQREFPKEGFTPDAETHFAHYIAIQKELETLSEESIPPIVIQTF